MKNFDYYNCHDLAFPVKPKAISLTSRNPSEDEIQKYLSKKSIYEIEMEKYNKTKDAYYAEQGKRIDEFWNDAREELGCMSYPDHVWGQCCTKAYEDGHSAGYSEIFNYLAEITCFVDSIIDY